VRRALGANLTGADIFRYRTVAAIAAKIEKERAESGGGDDGKKGGLPPSMASKPLGSMAWTYHFSPTSAPSLMLQSLPLLVFAPLQKITRWCIFLNMWSFCIHGLHPSIDFVHYVSGHTFISHVVRFAGVDPENEHFHHLRLCAFFAALACTALVSTIAFPLAACAFKWCVLGRLKPGLHPLWGQYYLRWWLSNKALEVSGPGFFGLNDVTYRVFLRLMGARVGKGAKIGRHVRIADYDCLDVHANATVDDFRAPARGGGEARRPQGGARVRGAQRHRLHARHRGPRRRRAGGRHAGSRTCPGASWTRAGAASPRRWRSTRRWRA
jgi:hypothetical protein